MRKYLQDFSVKFQCPGIPHREKGQQFETLAHCTVSSEDQRSYWLSCFRKCGSFLRYQTARKKIWKWNKGGENQLLTGDSFGTSRRQDSAAQRKLRVNKKGISSLGVEGVWIWPWRNISNLISCILLSSLLCPTFLSQMLSKPMGLSPK